MTTGRPRARVRTRRRAALLLVEAAVAVLGVVVVLTFARAHDAASPGPLKPAQDPVFGSLVPAEHPVFTDGMVPLELRGDAPARIDAVTIDATGLTLIGARVSGAGRVYPERKYQPAWPPSRRLFGPNQVDAVGAVIKPVASTSRNYGFELLLGYRIDPSVRHGVQRSVTVHYTVEGRRYAWVVPYQLLVCAATESSDECERRSYTLPVPGA